MTSQSNNMMKIREVSKDSVVRDFDALSRIAASPYRSYICIDTEFPGFIRNTPSYASAEQRYRHVKFNVDKLKMIQLGLTFYTQGGESIGYAWQINFREFDPAVDPHAADSVRLLRDNGIDFERNRRDGVDAMLFSRLLWDKLILPCRGTTRWVTFHGLYDLAYIVKLLMQSPLPNTLPEFLCVVKNLMGNVYDVKHIAKFCGFDETVGLVKMAEDLGIARPEGWKHHQAGHDSMLIGKVFWKIKEKFGMNEDCFAGVVHGAELCYSVPVATPPRSCLAPQSYFGVDQLLPPGSFYSPILRVYWGNGY